MFSSRNDSLFDTCIFTQLIVTNRDIFNYNHVYFSNHLKQKIIKENYDVDITRRKINITFDTCIIYKTHTSNRGLFQRFKHLSIKFTHASRHIGMFPFKHG